MYISTMYIYVLWYKICNVLYTPSLYAVYIYIHIHININLLFFLSFSAFTQVLKLSLNKVKRIEDPESFLRRSVLINNTIKRLQREVREEKMMRSGGYTSKLHSMHSSFRKSFASSRLTQIHLSAPDTEDLMDDPTPPRSSSFGPGSHNLLVSSTTDLLESGSSNNPRKRQISDESEDDCDVQAVLSQIYIPPTPCIISSLEEDEDCCDSTSLSNGSLRKKPRLSSTEELILSGGGDDLCCSSSSQLDDVVSSAHHVVVDDVDGDVDIDVDVVGDGDTSDWPTPPVPTPPSQNQGTMCEAMAVDAEDAINEFTLDLHLSSSTDLPTTTESPALDPAQLEPMLREPEGQSEDEEMKSSSDTKENTCELPPLLSPASCCSLSSGASPTNPLLLSSTMTDLSLHHHHKCSSLHHSSSAPNHNNNNNVMIMNSNPSAVTSTGSESSSSSSNGDKQSQYSSCGHSSIFGELQSVVFHSLIASLET